MQYFHPYASCHVPLARAQSYKAPKPDSSAAFVKSESHFGVRVLKLSALGSKNALDAALAGAVRRVLERLEANPAVHMVILQGLDDSIFSQGTDMKVLAALARGEGKYASLPANDPTRLLALSYLREQYALHHTVATYSKPIVATMNGAALGSGWALAQHAQYNYAADNSAVSLPEVGAGLLPHAGATYHLSRVHDGVGAWAALTGSVIRGEDTYWSGMASLYGTMEDLRSTLPREAGAVAGDYNTERDLHADPVRQRAVNVLREYRADGKAMFISNNVGEDVSREIFEEYARLKRWYGYWVVGDKASAERARFEDRAVAEEGADLFDFQQGQEVYRSGGGDDHPGSFAREPAHFAAERRARIGALSAHAAALFKGALPSAPRDELTAQLGVIRRAFGGHAEAGDVAQPVAAASASSASDAAVAAAVAKLKSEVRSPLPAGWEAETLKKPLHSFVSDAAQHLGLTGLPTPVVVEAVRHALPASWPAGQVSNTVLTDALAAVPGAKALAPAAAADVRDAVTVAVARATASLHKMPAWALTPSSVVQLTRSRAQSAADAAAAAAPGGAGSGESAEGPEGPHGFTIEPIPTTYVTEAGTVPVNPRIFTDPDGLLYDFHEEQDFWWPFTRGQWSGGKDVKGFRASVPIAPAYVLSPPPTQDPVGAAAALVRADVVRMLNVGLQSIAPYVQAAESLGRADASQAASLRQQLLGDAGDAVLASLMEQAAAAEGGAEDTDVVLPGDRERRMLMRLAWPQLSGLVSRMRTLVYTGVAAQANVKVSDADMAALVAAAVDSPAGQAALAAKARDGADAEAARLLRLWQTLLQRAQPKAQGQQQGGAAQRPGGRAPQQAPLVQLSEADKAELRTCALAAASWEALVLGADVGGNWAPVGRAADDLARYTLATVEDAESGLPRITLARRDASGEAAAADAASGAASAAPRSVEEARVRIARAAALARNRPGSRPSPLDKLQAASVPGLSPAAAAAAAGRVMASLRPQSGASETASGGWSAEALPPYNPPFAAEPEATLAARASGAAWDFDVVLAALTDASGRKVAQLFGLPLNSHTAAAGARVVDHFRKEADGRVALPLARSVEEIKRRLSEEVRARKAEAGSDAYAAHAAEFAQETLAQLDRQPAHGVAMAHGMLVRAASLPLADCMAMEYRAIARLLGADGGNAASLWAAGPTDALFAPLSNPSLDLQLPSRQAAAAVRAQREAAQAAWEAAFEAYIASGEGGGIFGDMFRRRYAHFRMPLAGVPYNAGADAAAIVNAENEARSKAGERSVATEARQRVGGGQRRPGGTDRRDRERERADATELAAAVMQVTAESYLRRGQRDNKQKRTAAAERAAALQQAEARNAERAAQEAAASRR